MYLEDALWSSKGCVEGQARSHWLAGLLRIEHDAYRLDNSFPLSDPATFFIENTKLEMDLALKWAKSQVPKISVMEMQVQGFQEDLPDVDLCDVRVELREVRRIIHAASKLVKDFKTDLEIQTGSRNIEVAELTIEEIRSGKTRKYSNRSQRITEV